ncbi:unnamed protein product [Paramecium sonneborni]|uniref:Transmembrane protein n=1 Tax=Paramecium sonneborni TaxID=65129 RepID=A0A8S1QKZ3_9CILI|nr:unnamed protein product [Paramecium sonneborni]
MFLIFFIPFAIALQCTLFGEDFLKIVGQKDENLHFPIMTAFQDWSEFSEYELIDSNKKTQLIKPIEYLDSGPIDITTQDFKIIQFHGVRPRENFWLNQYGILRIMNNQYQLIYSFHQWHSNEDRIPKFDMQIDIGSIDDIKCFDFVWMTSDSLLIDCFNINNEDEKNYFYFIEFDEQIIITTKLINFYPYSDQERSLYLQNQYLYRVTKKNLNNNQNQVEIFQFNFETLQINLITTINSQFFIDQNFTQKYKDYDKMEILDFKYDFSNVINLLFAYDRWTLIIFENKFKIYSFDFEFNSKHHILIGESFLYNSRYDDSRLNFSFNTTNYKAYYTKDFINLVSSESIIQIVGNKINFIKKGDFSRVLIDSSNNVIISIQENRILRFLNLDNVQLLYHPVDDHDLEIYQAQVNYKGCSLNIEYQTIASDSQQLIQVRKDESIFLKPFFASSIYQINYFNSIIQGPKISISILDESERVQENFHLSQPQKIAITGESIEDQIFLEILEFRKSDENIIKFMLITQDKSLLLTFQVCQSLNFQFDCSKANQIQLDFQLTKNNTSITFQVNNFYILNLISSEKLSFLQLDLLYFQIEGKIFPLDKEQEIDQLGYFSHNLILCSSKQEVIYIYHLVNNMILQNTFSSRDYQFIKPTKIFYQQFQESSKKINSFFLFNKEDQLLVYIYVSFDIRYILNQIQLIDVEDVKILFLKNKIALVQQKKDFQCEILIYNVQNQYNIFLEKSIPLYQNKIDNLQSVATSINHDALYIKSQNKILIYLVNSPRHNSLFQDIIVDQDVTDLFAIQDHLIFIQKEKLIIYSVHTKLFFSYTIKMQEDIFIQSQKSLIQYSNDVDKLILKEIFRFINMNTQLQIFQENFQIETKFNDEIQFNTIQDMGSNWYSGQVISFELLNENPIKKIHLIQPINQSQLIFYNNSRQVEDFDENKLFALSDYTYSLIDKTSGYLIKEFQFLDQSFLCSQILFFQDQNYIVSCIKNTEVMIYGIICKNEECQNSQGLLMNGSLTKVYLFEKTMFCIGQTFMLSFELQTSILEIDKSILLGQIIIDSALFSNTMLKVKSNHYQLYQLTFFGQLVIREFKINDQELIEFNVIDNNIQQYLNKDYYIDNQLVEIIILQTSFQNDLFQGSFIFFAKQGAHFGMKYNFTCLEIGCKIEDQDVFLIIQGYEDFQLLEKNSPKIKLKDDLLLILYQDWQSNSKFLAAYRIAKIYNKNLPVKFFGTIQFKDQYQRIENQLISYKQNKKEYILFNNYNYTILTLYEVNQSPRLVFKGIMKKSVQQIQIQNHFQSELLMFNIEIDQVEKSYLWLWILLGVIGGLSLIGIGIYLFKKKRGQQQDRLI